MILNLWSAMYCFSAAQRNAGGYCDSMARLNLIDGIITDSVRDMLEVLPDVEGCDLLARPHGSSTGGILHDRAHFL